MLQRFQSAIRGTTSVLNLGRAGFRTSAVSGLKLKPEASVEVR
jgi:hypothetical protein